VEDGIAIVGPNTRMADIVKFTSLLQALSVPGDLLPESLKEASWSTMGLKARPDGFGGWGGGGGGGAAAASSIVKGRGGICAPCAPVAKVCFKTVKCLVCCPCVVCGCC
jgi:hypothetical protein